MPDKVFRLSNNRESSQSQSPSYLQDGPATPSSSLRSPPPAGPSPGRLDCFNVEDRILVAVRVRPPIEEDRTIDASGSKCVSVQPSRPPQ
ncbi:hypothetical protein KIPB_011448, partial [Kipferlia bialata]|eukprot:g11448.t1